MRALAIRIRSHSYCPETVRGFEGPPEPRIICPLNRRHRPPRPCFSTPSVSPSASQLPLLLSSSLLVVSPSPSYSSLSLAAFAAFESRSHITCLPLYHSAPSSPFSLSPRPPSIYLYLYLGILVSPLSQPSTIDRYIGAHITPLAFFSFFFSFLHYKASTCIRTPIRPLPFYSKPNGRHPARKARV